MKNVLVYACGSISAVDLNFALRGNDEYRIFGASSYDDHGLYVYKNYIGGVPFIWEENFIEEFNRLLDAYSIDFVISFHEDIILFLQEHAAQIHAVIVSSCYETAVLCRYKSKTYEALKGADFVPAVYRQEEVNEYPVFVKKDDDQGARHAYKVETPEELALYASQPKMLICEYLPGEEATVDCFTDRFGKLRFVNPRMADRMLAGIDVHARRVKDDPDIYRIASELNDRISFRGPWFFQIKRDRDGRFKLLEIAARFAGAFALTLGMDMNTPLMAIRDFDEKDVEFSFNDSPIEADKIFITRYTVPVEYSTVICDGTVAFCIDGRPDPIFMMFLYQCINEGRQMVLLTADEPLDRQMLSQCHVPADVFQIVEKGREPEGLYGPASVLISRDESFRAKCRVEYQMYCYDESLHLPLIDWRA